MITSGLEKFAKDDSRCVEYMQFIVKELAKMFEKSENRIELLTLNNALADLCFDVHPTQLDRPGCKELLEIEYFGIHRRLVHLILQNLKETDLQELRTIKHA